MGIYSKIEAWEQYDLRSIYEAYISGDDVHEFGEKLEFALKWIPTERTNEESRAVKHQPYPMCREDTEESEHLATFRNAEPIKWVERVFVGRAGNLNRFRYRGFELTANGAEKKWQRQNIYASHVNETSPGHSRIAYRPTLGQNHDVYVADGVIPDLVRLDFTLEGTEFRHTPEEIASALGVGNHEQYVNTPTHYNHGVNGWYGVIAIEAPRAIPTPGSAGRAFIPDPAYPEAPWVEFSGQADWCFNINRVTGEITGAELSRNFVNFRRFTTDNPAEDAFVTPPDDVSPIQIDIHEMYAVVDRILIIGAWSNSEGTELFSGSRLLEPGTGQTTGEDSRSIRFQHEVAFDVWVGSDLGLGLNVKIPPIVFDPNFVEITPDWVTDDSEAFDTVQANAGPLWVTQPPNEFSPSYPELLEDFWYNWKRNASIGHHAVVYNDTGEVQVPTTEARDFFPYSKNVWIGIGATIASSEPYRHWQSNQSGEYRMEMTHFRICNINLLAWGLRIYCHPTGVEINSSGPKWLVSRNTELMFRHPKFAT